MSEITIFFTKQDLVVIWQLMNDVAIGNWCMMWTPFM
jgi:hypothetical protein